MDIERVRMSKGNREGEGERVDRSHLNWWWGGGLNYERMLLRIFGYIWLGGEGGGAMLRGMGCRG